MLCLNRIWIASSSDTLYAASFDDVLSYVSSRLEETKSDILWNYWTWFNIHRWIMEFRACSRMCCKQPKQKQLKLSTWTSTCVELKSKFKLPNQNISKNMFSTQTVFSHLGAPPHFTEKGNVEEKLKQLLFFNFVNGYRSFSLLSAALTFENYVCCVFIYNNTGQSQQHTRLFSFLALALSLWKVEKCLLNSFFPEPMKMCSHFFFFGRLMSSALNISAIKMWMTSGAWKWGERKKFRLTTKNVSQKNFWLNVKCESTKIKLVEKKIHL